MSFPAIHRPHAIVFPGPVYLKQFSSFSVNRAYNVYRAKAAGAEAPQWSGVDEGKPKAEFQTRDLKNVLDLLIASGQQGLVLGYSGTSTGTVNLYYRKGKNRGLRETASDLVHDRFAMTNNAMLYWTELSAEQGANNRAELSCVLKAISNDGLNPFLHTGSVAVVGTETIDYVYGMGRVKLNGTFLDSIARMSLANNLDADQDVGTDGLAFAQYADIENWEPTLTVETNDIGIMDDFEEPVAVTTLDFWFRKLTKNGLPVADATAGHIKFSATAGMAVATEGQGVRGRYTLQITLDKVNDATAPFTINTAAAIA
jgi:hypothetical protein